MENFYITIEREFGSRGTDIAKALSEKFNIPYYGFEILEQTAKRCSITVDRIEEYEEKITAYKLESNGDLNNEIKETIREFAMKGSSIFVGHCAADALKDKSKVIKIFIKADDESKKETMINDYHIDPRAVNTIAEKYDLKRSNYYSANTGKRWYDKSNYDIILNSGKLGIAGCVDRIVDKMIKLVLDKEIDFDCA